MEGEERGAIMLSLNPSGVLLNLHAIHDSLFIVTFVPENDSDSLIS